jgi:hypothetical protein
VAVVAVAKVGCWDRPCCKDQEDLLAVDPPLPERDHHHHRGSGGVVESKGSRVVNASDGGASIDHHYYSESLFPSAFFFDKVKKKINRGCFFLKKLSRIWMVL